MAFLYVAYKQREVSISAYTNFLLNNDLISLELFGNGGMTCKDLILEQTSIRRGMLFLFCFCFFFYSLQLSQLFPHIACLVCIQRGLKERVRKKRVEKRSLFVLYFPSGVPDLSSAGSARPSQPHAESFWDYFYISKCVYFCFCFCCLCFRMVSLPCTLPVRKTESR